MVMVLLAWLWQGQDHARVQCRPARSGGRGTCCLALDTCDPVDADDWSEANASRGQCGSTALTIHDLLGGELLIAEVHRTDGSRQGVHY